MGPAVASQEVVSSQEIEFPVDGTVAVGYFVSINTDQTGTFYIDQIYGPEKITVSLYDAELKKMVVFNQTIKSGEQMNLNWYHPPSRIISNEQIFENVKIKGEMTPETVGLNNKVFYLPRGQVFVKFSDEILEKIKKQAN